MQTCAVCEKPLYGHPDVGDKTIVCGSCTLTKTEKRTGRTVGEAGMTINKMRLLEVPEVKGQTMSMMKIRSNYARDKVIMISGGIALRFDEKGLALVPPQYRENVLNEIHARPGRFWFEQEVAALPPVVTPTLPVSEEDAETQVSRVELKPPVDLSPSEKELDLFDDGDEDNVVVEVPEIKPKKKGKK